MLKKKRLPVGISDFKKLISNNYYFVDKSLFIKEILESGAEATLIPRPRRFGKTLNLSMLRYFFEKTDKSNKNLFNNLAISKESEYMKSQGEYPVIYITFKDVKDDDWQGCYKNIIQIISKEFERHAYLLNAKFLSESKKQNFKRIIALAADESIYKSSLRELSTYLYKYHNKNPIILIDEYDAPIHTGFNNEYYDEIINFMKPFLSGGLKDNIDLEFSVLTGILKVAKESIFSDLNNLKVCTVLDGRHSDKFGLLESEVRELLRYYELTKDLNEAAKWYNGYKFGSNTVYNPWSIINFVDNDGEFQPYWINTSQNQIIKDLIVKNNSEMTKIDLNKLMQGGVVTKYIDTNIVLAEVSAGQDALWSLLLFSGYLTFNKMELKTRTWYADLLIPNEEVLSFFEKTISNWFKEGLGGQNYNKILNTLISGDIKTFSKIFKKTVISSFSYFDVSGKEPEKFYHAFVLGLLVSLIETHQVKSNRESGYGRYDIMIIPNDKLKPGIIIEFKTIDKEDEKDLEQAAQNALKQIEEKRYEVELNDLGIKKIIKLAIVFDGKSVFVKTTPN